jgi:aspartate aminotransferase
MALVRAAVTARTKVLILNSPSNPTGMLIERPALEGLAALALERELIMISDEIYDQLVYPPHQACSIVQAQPRVADRTVLVNGVSKTYSMTGWRIGYSAGPQPITDALIALQSHSTSNPTSISQHAALEAITGDQAPLARMAAEFHQRRDRLVNGLNRLPGLSCVLPDGAFYAWCNVSRLGQRAEALAARWLEEALVAVVPGEGFGSAQHVRFSFAASAQIIDEALARLGAWIAKQ